MNKKFVYLLLYSLSCLSVSPSSLLGALGASVDVDMPISLPKDLPDTLKNNATKGKHCDECMKICEEYDQLLAEVTKKYKELQKNKSLIEKKVIGQKDFVEGYEKLEKELEKESIFFIKANELVDLKKKYKRTKYDPSKHDKEFIDIIQEGKGREVTRMLSTVDRYLPKKVVDENGDNALHHFVRRHDLPNSKLIWEGFPQLLTQINNQGQTPLDLINEKENPSIAYFFKKPSSNKIFKKPSLQ